MQPIVMKFGGSSLATLAHVRAAAMRIKSQRRRHRQVVVVVSAMGAQTDHLASMVHSFTAPDQRERDQMLATGEQISAALMALTLKSAGEKAVSLCGFQLPIITDHSHGEANIQTVNANRLKRILHHGIIPVVTGFQGVTNTGDITTLGRGGSDLTAVAIAAAIVACACEIYTDVDGVFDVDPVKNQKAKRFDQLDYDTMLALSQNGAQVLHDKSIVLAKAKGVPIHVRSSFSHKSGTWIHLNHKKETFDAREPQYFAARTC